VTFPYLLKKSALAEAATIFNGEDEDLSGYS
jgi:hypothetical protein